MYSNRDAYGTPLQIESTLNGAPEVAYTLTTDPRGRVWTSDVTYRGAPFLKTRRAYYNNGYTHQIDIDWPGLGMPTQSLFYDRSVASDFVLTAIHNGAGLVYADLVGSTGPMRDPLGRLNGIELPASEKLVHYTYDLLGRVSTQDVTDSSAATLEARSYTYNKRGRLKSLQVSKPAATPSARLDSYQYREPGWLTNEHRRAGTPQHQDVTYTYDAAGNRKTKTTASSSGSTTSTLHYDYGNRLSDVDGNTVGWNDYGDTTRDHRGQLLAYEPTGDPAQFDDAVAGRVSFVRDAFGLPVGTITSAGPASGQRTQVWGNPGGGNRPLAGVSRTNQPVVWAVADGILVARIENGTTVHETSEDPKGSLLMFDNTFLDETGAFGDTVGSSPAVTEDQLYAGLEDLTSPYMFAQHRLYDAENGLFTSKDPVSQPGGDLRFAYVNNNPTTRLDPAGLQCFQPQVPLSTQGLNRGNLINYVQGVGGGIAWLPAAPTYVGPGYGATDHTLLAMAQQKDAAIEAGIDKGIEDAGGDPNTVATGDTVIIGDNVFEKQSDGSWKKTGEIQTALGSVVSTATGGGAKTRSIDKYALASNEEDLGWAESDPSTPVYIAEFPPFEVHALPRHVSQLPVRNQVGRSSPDIDFTDRTPGIGAVRHPRKLYEANTSNESSSFENLTETLYHYNFATEVAARAHLAEPLPFPALGYGLGFTTTHKFF